MKQLLQAAKKQLEHQQAKNIALYYIPGFFSKIINLILVPLYVTYLSVAEFGQLELLILAGTFLQYAFHIQWSGSYVRFYKEKDVSEDNLSRTLLIFRLGIQIFILAILYLFNMEQLAIWIANDPKLSNALVYVVLLYLLREYVLFFETRYKINGQAKRFAVLNVTLGIVQLLTIYYFFIIQDRGVEGIIWGQTVATGSILAGLLIMDGKWITFGKFDANILGRCFKYGLPMVPSSIALYFMMSLDRYMIKGFSLDINTGLEQVALYSLAYKFVFLMIVTMGFNIWWGPYVYSSYTHKNSTLKFSYVFRLYSTAIFINSMLILLIIPPVINFFPAYAEATTLAPILLAGFVAYTIGDYFCIGIGIKERTWIRGFAGVITVVINFSLNFYLIPLWGPEGAALGTALSYIVYVCILMTASFRLFPVNYSIITWVFPIFWLAIGFSVLAWEATWIWAYVLVGVLIEALLFQHAGGFKREYLMQEEGV